MCGAVSCVSTGFAASWAGTYRLVDILERERERERERGGGEVGAEGVLKPGGGGDYRGRVIKESQTERQREREREKERERGRVGEGGVVLERDNVR